MWFRSHSEPALFLPISQLEWRIIWICMFFNTWDSIWSELKYCMTTYLVSEVSNWFLGCSIVDAQSCLDSRWFGICLNGIFFFRGNPDSVKLTSLFYWTTPRAYSNAQFTAQSYIDLQMQSITRLQVNHSYTWNDVRICSRIRFRTSGLVSSAINIIANLNAWKLWKIF